VISERNAQTFTRQKWKARRRRESVVTDYGSEAIKKSLSFNISSFFIFSLSMNWNE